MTGKIKRKYHNVMCGDDLKIGIVLQRLMKAHQLTYGDIARELGIPKTTIFNYVQGCLPRSGAHLRRICQRFNISADELLFDEQPANTPRCPKKGQVIRGTFMIMEVEGDEPA
ncbi:MAG: hypothetical protein A2583_12540 [Bdellovibrionales bacterium RIFOXYD1_FULL_53_11]|nr:MAG: hypothetical protein A2583_12540 [Bdellovibrionales bacterium RIFOXYD1_FULL_53_11]